MEATKAAMEDEAATEIFDALLKSCASIGRTARSSRTLSSGGTKRRRSNDEEQTMMQRRVWDSQSLIQSQRNQQVPENDDSNPTGQESSATNNNSQADQRLLHSKLLDDALRQQQEELLLSRIGMSQPAITAAFIQQKPHTSSGVSDPIDDPERKRRGTERSMEHSRLIILREATRSRNRQVHRMLRLSRELDSVRQEQWKLDEERQSWEQKNRQVWNQIVELQTTQHDEMIAHNTLPTSNDTNNQEQAAEEEAERKIEEENILLSSVLSDLILGGGIDWNNDKRLRQTLAQLG